MTMTSETLFDQLERGISLERSQGLDVEVSHFVSKAWQQEATPVGYTFTQPWSEESDSEVWRIVRFLTYKSLFAMRRVDADGHREYTLLSCMHSGTGFKIVFRLTPGNLR